MTISKELVDPISTAVDSVTPGFAAMGGLGPPVRPGGGGGGGIAAVGLGPPVRPTPPPPWPAEYDSLVLFVDFYCGLTGSAKVKKTWPDPGPLLKSNAPPQVRATGLLLASAFLRRNAAREWVSADSVRTLLNDGATRLSEHAQSLLGG